MVRVPQEGQTFSTVQKHCVQSDKEIEDFVDVTLVCEDRINKAHKLLKTSGVLPGLSVFLFVLNCKQKTRWLKTM